VRRTTAAAAAALAAVAAAGVATPPAHAAKRMEIGLQDDPVLVDGAYYDRERALKQARQLGVTRIRVNVSWWETAGALANRKHKPKRIRWDWRKVDALIDAAARKGIRVQLTLTGPGPAWAMTDHRMGVYGPSARQYAIWVAAAARHFKRRVNRYALWNEPNHIGWMQPLGLAPALYREIYSAGYAAVKHVDKRAQVLIGELVPYGHRKRALAPLEFLRDVACARVVRGGTRRRPPRLARGPCGPTLRADGVAVHPYDYKRPPNRPYPDSDSATVGSLGNLTRTLTALARARALTGRRGRPVDVYLTEFGYFNSGKYRLPQARRAKYLRQAYAIAARNPHVRQLTQYTLVTPPPDFVGGYFDLSLVARGGRTLPPFKALSSWARSAGRHGRVARPGRRLKLPRAPRR